MLKEKGIELEHVPEDKAYKPDEKMKGGGTINVVVRCRCPIEAIT